MDILVGHFFKFTSNNNEALEAKNMHDECPRFKFSSTTQIKN